MRRYSRWGFTHWFGFCLVLGSLLRFWGLWEANRWYDEIFTAWAAVLPWGKMVAATAGDVHPPGYYALVWAVAHLTGSNAVWLLRLPSTLLSIAALPLLVLIGRRLKLSDTAIMGAVVFMAFAQFQIYYAQETRMYALLQVEVLVAVLAMLDRRWWLLGLSSAAMLYTHNYGFVYCGLIYLLAFAREMRLPVLPTEGPRCNVRGLLDSGVGALLLYLPWAPAFLAQLGAVGNWWQQPTTPGGWLEPFQQFVWGNPLGMLTPISQIVLYSLLAFAVWKLVRRPDMGAAQIAALAFGPMLIAVGTEALGMHPTYLYRTFIGSSGFVYLLLGWALDVAQPMRRWAWAVLAPLFVISVVMYYPVSAVSKGATDDFILNIADKVQPGDFIYHMNPGSLMSFRELYPERPEMYLYAHPAMENDIGTLSASTLAAFGVHQVLLEEVPWQRAWLVFSAGPTLGLAEDAEVLRLASLFNGQPILDYELWYSDLYKGQIWLLTR